MRNLWLFGLAGLLGLALCVATPGYAQEQKKTENQKTQTVQKPVAPEKAAEVAPRLPAGWGRLRLTAEQHGKVIDVMKKYGAQIQDLQAQIVELEKKQHDEMTALLTDGQKKELANEGRLPARFRSFRRIRVGAGRTVQPAETQEKKDKQ
jgi:hypothetical protein